jgi:hypothetical protein
MFGRRIKSGIGSVALAGVILGASAGSAAAADVWNTPAIVATTTGLGCYQTKDPYGIHWSITIGEPSAMSRTKFPSRTVRVTTQIDYSRDNVNWFNFLGPWVLQQNVSTVYQGYYYDTFALQPRSTPANPGSATTFFKAWYKVDFLDSYGNVVSLGGWWNTTSSALTTTKWDSTSAWNQPQYANGVCVLSPTM